MVTDTGAAARFGCSAYAPRHRVTRCGNRPRALLAAVLVGFLLVIAVPAGAEPVRPRVATIAARPSPAADLAHSLIYSGTGTLIVSVVGAALVAYRRRQY
jgi:hypothetical protein